MEQTLTFDQFIAKYSCTWSHDCSEYIRSFDNDVIECGFMPWNEAEAYQWAGAWGTDSEPYVLYTLTTKPVDELRSLIDSFKHHVDRSSRSYYNFPRRYAPNTELGYNSSLFTDEQLAVIRSEMTPEELMATDIKIAKHWLNCVEEDKAYCSLDRPYRIHLAGNDDCSHSATFETLEDAKSALESLIEFPNFSMLQYFGFQFTN